MQKFGNVVCATLAVFTVAACSDASDESVEGEAAVIESIPAEAQNEGDAQTAEVWEVCDEDGNRYPSEADAEAAGLDRAEYGATYCEYTE